jgi:hypothetical protein
MQSITLISTVHKEIGKCNSNELLKIIEIENPEVIFLEAFERSYTEYQKLTFSQFDVYHQKLEIQALQRYGENHTFEYIPVLDNGLSAEFDGMVNIVSKNERYQELLDNFKHHESTKGFEFLNSNEGIELFEEMTELKNSIINDKLLLQKANESIDSYENSMLGNIYSYCKVNTFNKAIFMCGAAHRISIIKKIRNSESKLNWKVYNDTI